jgi:hypothetical protein
MKNYSLLLFSASFAKTLGCVLPLALASLLCCSGANAATIDYTLMSGPDTIAFSIPQNPTPNPATPNAFDVNPLSVTIDGTTYSNALVEFFTPGGGGGVEVIAGVTDLVLTGQQLFTGTTSAPTLSTFSGLSLTNAGGGPSTAGPTYTLNASVAGTATPEPGSLGLAGVTLVAGGMLGRMRRRRRTAREGLPRSMQKCHPLALLAFGAFAFSGSTINAATITETFTLPNLGMSHNNNATGSAFAEFDPTLGTLNSVTIDISATFTYGSGIPYTRYLFNFQGNGDTTLRGDISVPRLSLISTATSAADLANFMGTGVVTPSVRLTQGFSRSASFAVSFHPETVVYDYTPAVPIPEPSSITILGAGLMTCVLVRRRFGRGARAS